MRSVRRAANSMVWAAAAAAFAFAAALLLGWWFTLVPALVTVGVAKHLFNCNT